MFNDNATAVTLYSIGCRTNQEEVAALRAELLSSGYRIADNVEDADIVVVNTCSVTSHTESKTKRFIQSISRVNPKAKIVATGCFAQQHGESLLKYPGVAWVVGNADKYRIPSIISNSEGGARLSVANPESPVFLGDSVLSPKESGRTRFSLKIQEGCDFRCAYCIVPSLRGPSRSAPKERLVDTFKRAVDMGYKEIVLTGTHIGQYRQHIGGNRTANLESLLEGFLKVNGDYRVRLSSLDPRDLTDAVVAEVGGNPRMCDHLHVSVQSLCADTLSLMDRPCRGLDALMERLRGFRGRYPEAGLGADFIVGHPAETEAMFEEALSRAEAVGFTYGHVFRYSKRIGTKSAKMRGQVGEPVKKARSAAMLAMLEKSREKFLSLLFARPLCIIIESENPVRGVSGNYIKVEVPGADAVRNTWMRVALTGAPSGGYRVANRLEPENITAVSPN
ncbi:MAG: MiaB/RimO family radical SAM methylthiotransferase [Chitinispirillales bacterium]|nr:MiaB/RimO family radical SAM methylthiotransferase [Chitinispirillales bacterium]